MAIMIGTPFPPLLSHYKAYFQWVLSEKNFLGNEELRRRTEAFIESTEERGEWYAAAQQLLTEWIAVPIASPLYEQAHLLLSKIHAQTRIKKAA